MKNFKEIFQNFLKPSFTSLDYDKFWKFCSDGKLDSINNLLERKKIVKHPYPLASLFAEVCDKGHMSIIQYLLTSSKTKEFHDIHIKSSDWAIRIFKKGHTEIIKYLYTSPDIQQHPDIHARQDFAFKTACYNNNIKVLECLVFDLNIQKNDEIKKYLIDEQEKIKMRMNITNKKIISVLSERPEPETLQYVNKIFDVRNLQQGLIKKDNINKSKRQKI